MSQRIAELRAEIALRQEEIDELPVGSRARVRLEADLALLRAELAALEAGDVPEAPEPTLHADQSGQTGGVNAGAGNQYGDNAQIGDRVAQKFEAAHQTIYTTIFQGIVPRDRARLLHDYLSALIAECGRLHLQRITGRVQDGAEQRRTPQRLHLQDVYTSLTTDGRWRLRYHTEVSIARLRRFITALDRRKRAPFDVRPERVIMAQTLYRERDITSIIGQRWPDEMLVTPEGLRDDTVVTVELKRPELALEAIRDNRLLVLLGDPGSGKSTVLRYLAILLARRLCGDKESLRDWPNDQLPVPVLVPLARVAASITSSVSAEQALWQTLGELLDGDPPLRAGLREALQPAVHAGGVILLCDGLDELPGGGADSPRVRVAAALRRLADSSAAVRMVITSRILPYKAAGAWNFRDGWVERTLQGLAFGQARTFITMWYAALVGDEFGLTIEQAKARTDDLVDQLEARFDSLEPLLRSPLLLTMLALLHLNSDKVPDDRAKLYEECVQLLLERWEPVRQPGLQRPGLIERLGNPPSLDFTFLRVPLHRLAFEAHRDARGDSGGGLIDAEKLRGVMFTFFSKLRGSIAPGEQVAIFEQVLREEAGLLHERGDQLVAFPHLTFQEYLAACHLAALPTMEQEAYIVWSSPDRERWREILHFMAARLRGQAIRVGLPWLRLLAAPTRSDTQRKPGTQRRRDAYLAAISYQAMGEDAAFAGLMSPEREILEPLREAIVHLVETQDPALPPADRLAAAKVLGTISDPRFPIEPAAWRRTLRNGPTKRFSSSGKHYWRYVPAGRYRIGGWNEEEPAVEHDLAAFWVARLPVTVAQFASFVQEGYREDRYWTPNGLAWRGDRSVPRYWGDLRYSGANQPMVNITWYEAAAFCRWLNAQLRDVLPAGYELRLPTEAEWEAAAAFAGPQERRVYPWGEPEPTPERAVYDAWKLNSPAPVGLCPAGAAACGALDIAGNVWEWCASRHDSYPDTASTFEEDFTDDKPRVPLRGGAYWSGSANVRCGARDQNHPGDVLNFAYGFRVVVSPPLAQTS